FGRTDPVVIEPLLAYVGHSKPDVVVVSGDLTQRARSAQFRQARGFLDRLPSPQVVVPGNHDVPLYDALSRFTRPYRKYHKYISHDLQPMHADSELVVLGVNTARALTIKGGRINVGQMARVRQRLAAFGPGVTKVIVTHHPFDLPPEHTEKDLVGRADAAMDMFAECGVDLLLAGHLHVTHAGSTAARYRIEGHAALVVQAGTATSTRGRGESNSFNVVRVDRPGVTTENVARLPAQGKFSVSSTERFVLTQQGWSAPIA
ncbi:MAG: metallophosphoesterase, partial [Burkholderiaceae bacterium]